MDTLDLDLKRFIAKKIINLLDELKYQKGLAFNSIFKIIFR